MRRGAKGPGPDTTVPSVTSVVNRSRQGITSRPSALSSSTTGSQNARVGNLLGYGRSANNLPPDTPVVAGATGVCPGLCPQGRSKCGVSLHGSRLRRCGADHRPNRQALSVASGRAARRETPAQPFGGVASLPVASRALIAGGRRPAWSRRSLSPVTIASAFPDRASTSR